MLPGRSTAKGFQSRSEELAPRLLLRAPALGAPARAKTVMAEPDRVAVFGATGRVGQMVTKKLLADGRAVTAVVRSADKAKDVLPVDDAKLECNQLPRASIKKRN